MIKCLCIDDSNKPNQIPKDKWVEKGKEYTILFSMTVLPQKQLAFQLNEIDLDDSCSPYTWFLANRFSFRREDLEALIDFIQECNRINFTINELKKTINIDEREPSTIEKD
jgi:hypothetical protein